MSAVRTFVRLWAGSSVAILGYAAVDLLTHPWLQLETSFSVSPDLARVPELVHWGGRLLHHRAWVLLILNAIVLGGLVGLILLSVVRFARTPADRSVERISVFPAPPE